MLKNQLRYAFEDLSFFSSYISDVKECSIKPCLNGGVCREMLGDYECQCPPGYEGKNCGIGKDKKKLYCLILSQQCRDL